MSDETIEEKLRRAARADAIRRETERARDVVRPRLDAPTPGAVIGGAHLQLDVHGTVPKYLLEGQVLVDGRVLDLYTNRLNGWVRGRFAWTGRRDDRPRIVLGIWDPHGRPDKNGLPPWVGDVEIPIAPQAVCRFPPDGTEETGMGS